MVILWHTPRLLLLVARIYSISLSGPAMNSDRPITVSSLTLALNLLASAAPNSLGIESHPIFAQRPQKNEKF
jgi:hypothetical protein